MTGVASATTSAQRIDPPEDDDIEAALQGGEARAAIDLAARRYGSQLGRLCMAMVGSQASAEELAQETLLTAHASLPTWRRESTLRAWLMGIARKKCLKHLETHRRRASKLYLIKSDDVEGADEVLNRHHRAERARALLSKIKPTEREALELRYAADLSFRDVAMAIGVEEPTARKRVSRGIARLRELLETTER